MEMGIDVKPGYRKSGLASFLITELKQIIYEKGIIPIYCAASSNLGSQAVAHRSGLTPLWVSTYKNIMDGSSAYTDMLKTMQIPYTFQE